MHIPRSFALPALVAALLACQSLPTVAFTGSSSASFSDLTFSVTDLTPNDGQAAGFTLPGGTDNPLGRFFLPSSGVRNDVTGQLARDDAPITFAGMLSPLALSASLPGIDTGVQTTPTGWIASGSMSIPRGLYASSMHFDAGLPTDPNNPTLFYFNSLVLAPNTSLRISILASTSALINPDCVPGPTGCPDMDAGAHAVIEFWGSMQGSGLRNGGIVRSLVQLQGPLVDTDSGVLFIDLVNDTATSRGAAFNVQLGISAHSLSTAVPIPEPQTYALMLAGLALFVPVVRRRRREVH